MGNFRSIILVLVRWLEGSLATLVVIPYYRACPPRASWTARTRRGILLTKDLSLSGLRTSQEAIAASCNCYCVVGVLSISRIWISIWSQICSVEFISGLFAGQSMTYTSLFSIKVIVEAGHSLYPGQDILPEPPSVNLPVHGGLNNDWHALAAEVKAPHTMMDCITLTSVCCCTQASIYLSPSRLRTRIRPSLRYSLKRDSSEKTQCLQWRRSQSRCRRAHCRRRRRCSLVSLRHLAGMWEGYPAIKSRRLMVWAEIRRPVRRLNSTLKRGLE